MNINKIIITGRLVKDPEIKNIGENELCNFRLASNRVVGSKKVEKSIFIDVDTWGGQAKTCQKFLKKGSKVIVEGILCQDIWKGKDGESNSKIYIESQNVVFLDSNNSSESSASESSTSNNKQEKVISKEVKQEVQKNINTKKNQDDDDLPF